MLDFGLWMLNGTIPALHLFQRFHRYPHLEEPDDAGIPREVRCALLTFQRCTGRTSSDLFGRLTGDRESYFISNVHPKLLSSTASIDSNFQPTVTADEGN